MRGIGSFRKSPSSDQVPRQGRRAGSKESNILVLKSISNAFENQNIGVALKLL